MRRHFFFLAALVLATAHRPTLGWTRGFQLWTQADLEKKADLVVIAHPTETRRTKEKRTFETTTTVKPLRYLGVETTFKVIAVKKGTPASSFVLHHYRLLDKVGGDPPMLVEFDPKNCENFLMYLTKRTDGQFEPLSGQLDATTSVRPHGCGAGS